MTHRKSSASPLRQNFLRQLQKLWPAIKGSLAEVRKPCIRPNCPACARGDKHPAFILSFTDKGRRRCMYVPTELASISTVMEWTNAKAVSEDQAKSITSFLLPNQGMGTGWLANPEATRNGLWARLSKVTWTRASSMVTVAETSRRLRKSFLA